MSLATELGNTPPEVIEAATRISPHRGIGDEMKDKVMGVIGKNGVYPVEPTSFHPDHRVGEIAVEGGTIWDVTTSPVPGRGGVDSDMRLHLKRTDPTGAYTRVDVVFPGDSNNVNVAAITREANGTVTELPLGSEGAVFVARRLTTDFASLNGDVRRAENHRGAGYNPERDAELARNKDKRESLERRNKVTRPLLKPYWG